MSSQDNNTDIIFRRKLASLLLNCRVGPFHERSTVHTYQYRTDIRFDRRDVNSIL